MSLIIHLGLLILGAYLSFYALYSILLLGINFFIPEKSLKKEEDKVRFVAIIPAHNEELFINRTLNSFREQNYPTDLFQVIVVADNCTDNTTKCITGDNIEVLERYSKTDVGKGYAIQRHP